jgi:hypothetical protein
MLALIAGFSNDTIFAAYQQQFNLLTAKGYEFQLNVMNNQARKVIKKMDEKQCDLLVIKPHNHCVNTAKHAMQTFKVHFISTLATTNSEFPLQMWDHLTPQVKSKLNMMPWSGANPDVSAYEAIHGPYDWNRFPLAPPGCKAIVYKSPETQGSWGSRGIDACCVGPLLDHYHCNHVFVPETRANQICGFA